MITYKIERYARSFCDAWVIVAVHDNSFQREVSHYRSLHRAQERLMRLEAMMRAEDPG
jgi:hypothetical protein